MADDPNLTLVAEWTSVSSRDLERAEQRAAAREAELAAAGPDELDDLYQRESPQADLYKNDPATHYAAAVFRIEDPG
jgi:hypothetical protein